MNTPFISRLTAAGRRGLLSTASPAQPIKHHFLALDEGLSNIMHLNQASEAELAVHVGTLPPRHAA